MRFFFNIVQPNLYVCRSVPCWNGVELKGKQYGGLTLLWTKPLSEVLTRWARVRSLGAALNFAGQRHHRSNAPVHIHLVTSHGRPVAFVLLIVLHFFKALPGIIGHMEAFMCSKQTLPSYIFDERQDCAALNAAVWFLKQSNRLRRRLAENIKHAKHIARQQKKVCVDKTPTAVWNMQSKATTENSRSRGFVWCMWSPLVARVFV